MGMNIFYEAVKTYEGRVQRRERAYSVEEAKTRIRNHLYMEEPPEWEKTSENGKTKVVLQNPSDSDVEVEITEQFVYGEPDLLAHSE